MGCPICGRIYCDHTPDERGQNWEEMDYDMNYGESGVKGTPRKVVRDESAEKKPRTKSGSKTK